MPKKKKERTDYKNAGDVGSVASPTDDELHADGDAAVPRPGQEPEEAGVYGGLHGVLFGCFVVGVALEHLVAHARRHRQPE